MRDLLKCALAAGALFGFEQGAEMSFPDLGPHVWWSIGIVCSISILIVSYWRPLIGRFHSLHSSNGVSRAPEKSTEIPADGRAAARQILSSASSPEADRIRRGFFNLEDRFDEHFVNRAYMRRLDELGETDSADAVYEKFLSSEENDVALRRDIEFAYLVEESKYSEQSGSFS